VWPGSCAPRLCDYGGALQCDHLDQRFRGSRAQPVISFLLRRPAVRAAWLRFFDRRDCWLTWWTSAAQKTGGKRGNNRGTLTIPQCSLGFLCVPGNIP
jgi:hypothetical protein